MEHASGEFAHIDCFIFRRGCQRSARCQATVPACARHRYEMACPMESMDGHRIASPSLALSSRLRQPTLPPRPNSRPLSTPVSPSPGGELYKFVSALWARGAQLSENKARRASSRRRRLRFPLPVGATAGSTVSRTWRSSGCPRPLFLLRPCSPQMPLSAAHLRRRLPPLHGGGSPRPQGASLSSRHTHTPLSNAAGALPSCGSSVRLSPAPERRRRLLSA